LSFRVADFSVRRLYAATVPIAVGYLTRRDSAKKEPRKLYGKEADVEKAAKAALRRLAEQRVNLQEISKDAAGGLQA
jgi:hypothetical protein